MSDPTANPAAAVTTQPYAPLDSDMPDQADLDEAKSYLTPEEIEALSSGDDPIFTDQEQNDAGAAAASEAAAAATAAAAAPQVDEPKLAPMPDLSQVEAQIAQFDEKLNALTEQYDDGALTRDEFAEKQRQIINEQTRLNMELANATKPVEESRAAYADAWYKNVGTFMEQQPFLKDDAHLPGWDAALKSVTGSAQYANLPMAAKINLAYSVYAAHHEATTGAKLPALAAKAAAVPAQDGPRTDPRPDAPVTLAGFSEGDMSGVVDDGRFADIDRKATTSPLAAEAAFARMTPEQQAAFLAD